MMILPLMLLGAKAVPSKSFATMSETKAKFDPRDPYAYQQVTHSGGKSIPIASPHQFPAHLGSEEPQDDDKPTKTRSQPKIRLIGPKLINVPVLRTTTDKHVNEYRDMGAKCFDEVDGLTGHGQYPLMEVAGEVVNLARIGTYTITYRCANSAGVWAVPLKRTVVVTGAVMHDCKTINVKGLEKGHAQADRMGTYVLNNYYHGRPEYKQDKGRSWLYFRSNMDGLGHSWVVDGYNYMDMRGLHVQSDAERPDKIHDSVWSFLSSKEADNGLEASAKWVKDSRITVTCVDQTKNNKLIWYPHFTNYNGEKLTEYKTNRVNPKPATTPVDKLQGSLRGSKKAFEAQAKQLAKGKK